MQNIKVEDLILTAESVVKRICDSSRAMDWGERECYRIGGKRRSEATDGAGEVIKEKSQQSSQKISGF